MKRKSLFSLLVVLVLLVGLVGSAVASEKVEEVVNNYFANLPSDNHKISQLDFIDKVKAGEDLFILDIRQPDVYNEAHVKGAFNAPWGPDFTDCLDSIPADEVIYVYCYSGQTAGQTVALLNFAGFDAKSVNLGWNLGISRVDGYEAVTETKVNELEVTSYNVDPEIKSAIVDYYKGLADVSSTMFKNYKISEDMLKMMIDAEQDVTILSIRQPSAYAEGHIPGAINIGWGKGMQEYFGQLPKDKKVIVYCYTGQTAGQTVGGLRMLGYDAVSLNGGMGMASNNPSGWANKGFEVVK